MFGKISRKIRWGLFPIFAILVLSVAGVCLLTKNASAASCDSTDSCSISDTDKACANLGGSTETSKGYGCALPKGGKNVTIDTCKNAGGHPVDTNYKSVSDSSKLALCEFYLSDFPNPSSYTKFFKALNKMTENTGKDDSIGNTDNSKLKAQCENIKPQGKTTGSATWVGGSQNECDVPASISDALKTANDCTKLGGVPNTVPHPESSYSVCTFSGTSGEVTAKLNSLTSALNQFDQQTQEIAKEQAKEKTDTSSKCAMNNGLGFIICPAMWLMSSVIDNIYSVLAKVLDLPVNLFTDAAVMAAVKTFLPFANILLGVVFLLIIYSEATGGGFGVLSNYSIKKTLPRLVIFAILINMSFYVCAAAVDVSNIVGSGIYKLFTGGDQTSLTTNFETHTREITGTNNYDDNK